MLFRRRRLAFVIGTFLAAFGLEAATFHPVADRASGVYEPGQTIRWVVTWDGADAPPNARYRVLRGQLMEAAAGPLELAGGSAQVDIAADGPGTLLLEILWTDAAGKAARATAGVVIAPEAIATSGARPRDFQAFWQAKLAELRAVAAEPNLEAAQSGVEGVAYWRVSMSNIRGTRIHAQLARPSQGEKLPALLIVQWAGVYGLDKAWVTDRAQEGWLVLNVMPHDLPIDQPPSFYEELKTSGPLKDYWALGNDDRETSYYLRMYLSCIRGADFLTERDDWDGRTLVVMGGSQGGMQALVTASLHPKVTAALASVPAGCDLLGPASGRKGGWPQWYEWTAGKNAGRVLAAGRYFDVTHFAPDIRCPVLIGVGLRDEVCPPEGIFATANQISSATEIVILPVAGHGDEEGSHAAYNTRCYGEWLPALRRGEGAPVSR